MEWPEAKKKADQVRQWGIEVCAWRGTVADRLKSTLVGHTINSWCSNYWQIGDGPEARKEMLYSGVMRYVELLAASDAPCSQFVLRIGRISCGSVRRHSQEITVISGPG